MYNLVKQVCKYVNISYTVNKNSYPVIPGGITYTCQHGPGLHQKVNLDAARSCDHEHDFH